MSTNSVCEKNDANNQETDNIYGYDSLLTVIKLAILQFYDVGTKLSFYNNKIYIQPPSYTQGAARKLYGNSKTELVQLFVPIKQCIDKYVFKENNSYVKEILRSSVKGLELLQKTYITETGIILEIQFLINLIRDSLEGRNYEYKFLKTVFGDYENKLTYDELWNDLSINVLNKHLNSSIDEFLKMEEMKKNENKDTLNLCIDKFKDQKSKLDGFINAKEKRYSEFLEKL